MPLVYNVVPTGYFWIFEEIADMVVHRGQSGIHIDSTFMPDGSVGIHLAKYWNAAELKNLHASQIKYDHNYPAYAPQALSNPQESNCYPEIALGEFRRWFRGIYIGAGNLRRISQRKLQPGLYLYR